MHCLATTTGSLVDVGSISLAAVLAALLVPVVSLLKKEKWAFQFKYFIAILCSLAAASVTTYVDNSPHTWHAFLALWGVTTASMQTTYHMFFASTVANQKLTDIGN